MSTIYSLIIVDDEYSACELLKYYVTDYCKDFEIAGIFADGSEAIDFLEKNDVDLVLTDIKMPRVSGIELAKYIHENKSGTNVVAVSAYSEFEYVKDLMKYGVTYYLLKFVDLTEFLEVMDIVRSNLKKGAPQARYDELQAEMFFFDLFENNFSSCEEASESYAELELNTEFADAVCTRLSFCVQGLREFKRNRWHYTGEMMRNAFLNIVKLLHIGMFVTVLSFDEEKADFVLFDRGREIEVEKDAVAAEVLNTFGLCAADFVCENILLKDICTGNYEGGESGSYLQRTEEIEIADMELPPIVKLSAEIIEKNFSMPIIRSEIAQKLHVNVVYLSKVFKQYTGKTLMTYLFEVRLKKAVELVMEGKTIYEICGQVGYNDERSFRRAFKKYTGYSVREYKRAFIHSEKEENK